MTKLTGDTEKVSVVACDNYERKSVYEAVKRAVELVGGIEKFVNPGSKVLVKPNLLMGKPAETAVCTHPEILHAVCSILKAHNCKVVIADSPGAGIAYTQKNLKKVYDAAGYTQILENLDVEFNFDTGSQVIKNPNGFLIKQFEIINPVHEADAVIVLSKLKTHIYTSMTAGAKNLFGVVPGLDKPTFHARFPDHNMFGEVLLDLNLCIKPVFQLVDAVIGMEGNGPMSGSPRHIGAILASADFTAVDVAAAQLIGYDPLDVCTIKAAVERDLNESDLSDVEFVGDDLNSLKVPDFIKPETHISRSGFGMKNMMLPLMQRAGRSYTLHPVLVKNKCVGCGQCAKICPVDAIVMKNKKPVFDLSSCIRCYCCHEMCDSHAIKLKSGILHAVLRPFLR